MLLSRRKSPLFWALALVYLSPRPAVAQAIDLTTAKASEAGRATGVSLVISAGKSEFYLGELIPLQLTFTSNQVSGLVVETRSYDRIGRMNGEEEFLIDPAALTDDPLRGLQGEAGGLGGISAGDVSLDSSPFTIERLLNEWVRFVQPGTYRVAVQSRRASSVAGPAREPLTLISNILTLTIVAAQAAWVNSQVSEAVGILDSPLEPIPSDESSRRRARAIRTLRFLDSPEAAIALAEHLDSTEDRDGWSLDAGILGSQYRAQLLPVIEARLTASDVAVSFEYLDTLSRLAELVADGGPIETYPQDVARQGAWQTESRRRDHLREEKRAESIVKLIATLPAKRPGPRAVSLNTLLDIAQRDVNREPPWLPGVTASLVADFRSLPPRMQSNLLEHRWAAIRNPAMLPVLRDLYAHPPKELFNPPLQDAAVRRLDELAPDEARHIILSQIVEPNTELTSTTLGMLPDRSLPERNDALVESFEAGHSNGSMILRYATGDVAPRVEKAYLNRNKDLDRQKLPHCGDPLIYYFLRYDPEFGEKELRAGMDKPSGYPGCYDIGFQFLSLDRNAYSPALERLAIEFLGSPRVPVKRGAAEVLGKYGSAAAEKPLWDTFEYFHSYWNGRQQELEGAGGQEGVEFERTLRIALAQAGGWKLDSADLNRLHALCVSGWCKREIDDWIAERARR